MKMNKKGDVFDFFVMCLTLMFIFFKLTGEIDWSWWWVVSPIWITFAMVLLILFMIFFYYIIRVK